MHRDVGGPGLVEAALEPAVHRRGLHRPVAVLAQDALQVEVRTSVAGPDGVKQVLVRLRTILEREAGKVARGPSVEGSV
jgi:hypothetical protein